MPLPPINISDAVQKAAYDDLAKGSMRQFGDVIAVMVGRVLHPQRKSTEELALDWQRGEEESVNRRRLAAEAIDRVPIEQRIFPASQIAGPIFRDSEFELPETPIWEMWSQLLSRACNRDRLSEAHPSFLGIIRDLSAAEAAMLDSMYAGYNSTQPFRFIQEGIFDDTGRMVDEIGKRFNADPDPHGASPPLQDFPNEDWEFCIEHLKQLGLIDLHSELKINRNTWSKQEAHLNAPYMAMLTVMGLSFMNAVSPRSQKESIG